MTIHGTLFNDYREITSPDPFALQNKKLLKIQMQYGPVWARTGSMVAYQGDVRFQNKGSGGLDKLLKSKLTGEGVDLMQCTGNGELFVADSASEIQVLYLADDMLSVNGSSVLAFSDSIQWDIHRIAARGGMMAGGMFNVALQRHGLRRGATKGDPVALDVASAPTFADANAVVCWTAGVSMDVRVDTGGLGSMLARRHRRADPDGVRRSGLRDRPAQRVRGLRRWRAGAVQGRRAWVVCSAAELTRAGRRPRPDRADRANVLRSGAGAADGRIVQTPVRVRRSGAPLVRRASGPPSSVIGLAVIVWSLVPSVGDAPAFVWWGAGAALVAPGLALAVAGRADAAVPSAADGARTRTVVEHPMDETELRTRIPVLADIALAEGMELALVLVGPADTESAMPVEALDRLLATLAALSRGDDLRADLRDAAGVLLPSVSCDEACGYAARVASALGRDPDGPVTVCVGVALTGADAYPASALLRRARRALAVARESGPGAIVVSDSAGTRVVDRRSLAARPSVGRRARR